MASSITCGPALWMDGTTINGLLGRTFDVAASFLNTGAAQLWGGVVPSGGQLQVTAASGMTLNVATGYAVVPSSSGSTQGGYVFGLTAAGTLAVATADPTNPRIDLVCATAVDNGDDTSYAEIQIVTGTPAPSPAAPALPANSIPLAQVTVAANATSINTGNIVDTFYCTVAQGGILPIAGANAPVGYTGMYIHDPASGRLLHNPASGPEQPRILPWAPVAAVRNTNWTFPTGNPSTILSVPITTDGQTDIEVTYHWVGVFQGNSVGNRQLQLTVWCDDVQLDEVDFATTSNDEPGIAAHGGTAIYTTSSTTSDTPSAGEHTIYFKGISGAGGGNVPAIRATPTRNIYLRVAPATQ